jgi:hypothetical protein
MPCSYSCLLATSFIIAMIYFQNATANSPVVRKYKSGLPAHLQRLYEKIADERLRIHYYGYGLGFILSLLIIFYNYSSTSRNKLTTSSTVCLVIVVSFLTNYFYYILSPKSAWMLDHMKEPEEIKAWLSMYRSMQVYYHTGFVLGIIAIGIFAFAFRC